MDGLASVRDHLHKMAKYCLFNQIQLQYFVSMALKPHQFVVFGDSRDSPRPTKRIILYFLARDVAAFAVLRRAALVADRSAVGGIFASRAASRAATAS